MVQHVAKIDLVRGFHLVFTCDKCGNPAVLDIRTGKIVHAASIVSAAITDALTDDEAIVLPPPSPVIPSKEPF